MASCRKRGKNEGVYLGDSCYHLTCEQMLIVHFPTENKSQMFEGVSGLLSSVKEGLGFIGLQGVILLRVQLTEVSSKEISGCRCTNNNA